MFLTNFESVDDVIDQYEAPKDALEGAKVLLAWYGYGSYDGQSFVLFEKDGKLYEVNGGHCSCNGLEGQWEPEETTWEALKMRQMSNYSEGEAQAYVALQNLIAEHK